MEMPKIEVYAQFYGRIKRRTASGPRVVSIVAKDSSGFSAPDYDDPDRLGCYTDGDVLVLDAGMLYSPCTPHISHGRGHHHSLNDGLRDTRWRKADIAVKRWARSVLTFIKGIPGATVDEVPGFIGRVVGAALIVYAVVVAAVHFYG